MNIITYGTLRKDLNYHDYLKNSKFISKEKIKGFDLYNLYSYPAVLKGDGKIIIEIYEVSEEVFNRINQMEKAVGYKSEEIIVNDIKATIWFFDKKELKRYKKTEKIEHGDYFKFKHEERLRYLKKYLKDTEEEIIKIESEIKNI